MSRALDRAYLAQRLALTDAVAARAAALWRLGHEDELATLLATVSFVEAGQREAAALVDAYLAEKTGLPLRGLDSEAYTIAALRGLPADEVYRRPWGALGGQLQQGASFEAALESGVASVDRLARTDLQLTQTHASRDWLAGERRVQGYRRVLGPGENCSLCRSSASRLYFKDELMPIHERCHCTVSPVMLGEDHGLAEIPSRALPVKVADDPELGPRLLDEEWAA